MMGLSAKRESELHKLEKTLGVTFRDLGLLHTALTHTSYANEGARHVMHNERLEFLGDAVLELAVSTYLFTHFRDFPEGDLTRTRASLVCSASLARLAKNLRLGDYLLLGHGEAMGGGRARTTNLEDSFEAVFGAIYIDQGWDVARECALRQFAPAFGAIKQGATLRDYKTLLQEKIQHMPGHTIEYELIAASGPDHAKRYEIAAKIDGEQKGTGEGSTKKEAEQCAAKEALASLGEK